MSWDVILVKEKFDLNDADYKPIPLGDRDSIINELLDLLPTLDYSDKSWGIIEGEGFSIEFNTGDKQLVDSIMLHIRGGGKPTEIIDIIMNKLNWEALDCSSSEFMEKGNIDDFSWIKFQAYRDKIVQQNRTK